MAEEEIKKEVNLQSLVERAEKANAEMRELLNKQAELAAKNILSGNTNAGAEQKKEKEEKEKKDKKEKEEKDKG